MKRILLALAILATVSCIGADAVTIKVHAQTIPTSQATATQQVTVPSGQAMVASTAPQSFTTTISWGDWLAAALSHVQAAAVSAAGIGLTFFAMRLPAVVRPLVSAMVQEQWLSRAIDYGFAAVEGAVKGKTLDLKTSNAVLAHAEAYAATVAPDLAKKLGDLLLPKLVARLSSSLAPDVTASNLNAAVKFPV